MSTRDNILAAATKLFSELGFAAGTEAIVTAAKVNKRMLYHYFGDKDGLVREVLTAQWQAFALDLVTALQREATPQSALDALFDFVSTRPQFLRLVMWVGLAGGKASRAIWGHTRLPLFEQALVLLGGPRLAAKRRATLVQNAVTLLGATAVSFAFAPSLADVFGADPLTPAQLRARRAHLHALLAYMLSA